MPFLEKNSSPLFSKSETRNMGNEPRAKYKEGLSSFIRLKQHKLITYLKKEGVNYLPTPCLDFTFPNPNHEKSENHNKT